MYHTTYLYVSIDQINSTRSNIGFTEVDAEVTVPPRRRCRPMAEAGAEDDVLVNRWRKGKRERRTTGWQIQRRHGG